MTPVSINFAVGMIGLILAVPMLVLGTILLRMGHWPKRKGGERHCARCDYLLTGLASDRCPECGTELGPDAIVLGKRQRRAGLAVTGVTFILLAAVSLIPMAGAIYRGVDWYQYRPTNWLISDLETGRTPTMLRAWRPLVSRGSLNKLTSAQIERVAAVALKEQASPPPSSMVLMLLEFLARVHDSGQLNAKQTQQFYQHSIGLQMILPPKVRHGMTPQFNISEQSHLPRNWSVFVVGKSLSID